MILKAKKEILPIIIQKNIDHTVETLNANLGRQEKKKSIHKTIHNLFGFFNVDEFERIGYGYEQYIRDNPDQFQLQMKQLFNALLENPLDTSSVKIMGENKSTNRNTRPLQYDNPLLVLNDQTHANLNGKLLIRDDLFDKIVDQNMLARQSSVIFRMFKEGYEANPKYKDLSDLFKNLDEYFKPKSASIRLKERKSDKRESSFWKFKTKRPSHLASDLDQIQLDEIHEIIFKNIPFEFREIAEKYPDIIKDIMEIRYIENTALYEKPLSSVNRQIALQKIKRLFSALEEAKRDPKLLKLISGTVDFDNLLELSDSLNIPRKKTLSQIADNIEFFSKSGKRALITSADIDSFIKAREDLMSMAWNTKGFRGEKLNSVLEVILKYPDTSALNKDAKRLISKFENQISNQYFAKRFLELYQDLPQNISESEKSKRFFSPYLKSFPHMIRDLSTQLTMKLNQFIQNLTKSNL